MRVLSDKCRVRRWAILRERSLHVSSHRRHTYHATHVYSESIFYCQVPEHPGSGGGESFCFFYFKELRPVDVQQHLATGT